MKSNLTRVLITLAAFSRVWASDAVLTADTYMSSGASATLPTVVAARPIHQNPAYEAARHGVKMNAVGQGQVDIDQPQVRFMDHGCGAECMIGALGTEVAGCESTELVVHEGHQFV